MNARKILPYLLVTLAVAMWGVSFVLTKAIFNSDAHYTATIIVFFRLLFSVVIFVPILFIVRKVRKIEKGDLCYRLFIEKGFEWGGDWTNTKDYQHFELPTEITEKYSEQYAKGN